MAVKERHLGSETVYPLPDTEPQMSVMSSWLTGLILLFMVVMVTSIVSAAVQVPHTGAGQGDNPHMVLPEGGSMPGTRNADALETVAGTPADTHARSIDSPMSKPDTDRLPGRDDRKPQPVPAPI